jgi:hypothetical protein
MNILLVCLFRGKRKEKYYFCLIQQNISVKKKNFFSPFFSFPF